MINVSNDFKNQLTQPKTIDAKITIGNDEITSDDINNISRTFNSSLFKTVVKSVNIDSNVPIEKNTEIEPQFGVYINNGFEYVHLGTYKTKDEPILNKDTNSYQTIAYDRIVDSMVDYALTNEDITFPCTVRDLFIAIFNKLQWPTSGIPDSFVNSSSVIQEDVYSRANMTYRDVLDELCTISCMFLIDKDNPILVDKNLLATITEETGTNIHIENAQNEQIGNISLKGDTQQNTTTGKNLLELSLATIKSLNTSGTWNNNVYTLNNVTFTINDDYTIKVNGTANANTTLTLTSLIINSYNSKTLNGCPSDGSSNTYRLYCDLGNEQGQYISNANDYGSGVSIDTSPKIRFYILVKSGTNASNLIFKPMVSTSGGDFEPYTNGASPNPSYPQPVNVVTGDNEVVVCGKNLSIKNIKGYFNTKSTKINVDNASESFVFYAKQGETYTFSSQETMNRQAIAKVDTLDIVNSTPISNVRALGGTTFTSDFTGYCLIYVNSTLNDNIKNSFQVEVGNEATTYEAYQSQTYPIYLGVENLFDGAFRQGTHVNTSTANCLCSDNEMKSVSGKQYTFYTNLPNTFKYKIMNCTANGTSTTVINDTSYSTSGSVTVNCSANGYLKILVKKSDDSNLTPSTITGYTFQVGIGTNRISNQPIELCKIGDYQDYIYKDNGSWYIHKEIGKVVLDGSESNWWKRNDISVINAFCSGTNVGEFATHSDGYCNYFQILTSSTTDTGLRFVNSTGYGIQCQVHDEIASSVQDFKTWLSNHNTIVYFPYITPTNTIITDTELIEQLESVSKIETFKGVNNITISSSNLASPITIGYVSDVETINEEYMSDTSVEIRNQVFFNSLVFSRASDSDNIFRKDDDSIDANGLHEFKVRDLQILSLNWRDNFIDEMWNYIKKFKYYAYDVNTVGLSYLEPIDGFYLSTFGETYPTILLNSDLAIGNGVNEKIYANEPVESETEYKYADTTDRKINQAYIIVDKQNVQIQALTQTTSNIASEEQTHYQEMLSKMDDKASISDIETITNQVNVLQTDTYTKTEINKILNGTDESGNVVSFLQTLSATLDENGMSYNKTGANTSSNINETGVTVTNKKNNSELLFAGYDEQKLEALVRVANLYLTRFLGVDVWRIEIINDTTNGKGLGFFYIG